MKDYYKVLGIPKNATAEEIKKKFRALARKHHPDVNKDDAGAEERFKEINEAYAVLSDPEKRQKYDMYGAEGFKQRFSQEDIYRGSDVFSVLNDLFGGSGGGRGGGFESIFGNIFGGGGGSGFSGFPGQGGPRRGQDYEVEFTVTLEEAHHGGKRRLSLQAPDGHTMNLDVGLPKGVGDGQKLRLRGKGGAGSNGGPAGDLMVTVRVAPHLRFSRDGDDLLVDLDVPFTTLALGGSVDVLTLEGETRALKIKAGLQSGSRMRVRGAGINHRTGRGDLYVTLRGKLPDKLTEEQRKLFEKLKEAGA